MTGRRVRDEVKKLSLGNKGEIFYCFVLCFFAIQRFFKLAINQINFLQIEPVLPVVATDKHFLSLSQSISSSSSFSPTPALLKRRSERVAGWRFDS